MSSLIDYTLLVVLLVEGLGFAALYRIDRSRDHLRYWSVAWVAIGIAGFLLPIHVAGQSISHVLLGALLISLALVGIGATLAGSLRLQERRIPRYFPAAFVVLWAILLIIHFGRFTSVGISIFLLANLFGVHLFAAVLLWKGSRYARVAGGLFALATCNQVVQVSYFGGEFLGFPTVEVTHALGVFIRTGIAIALMLDAVSRTQSDLEHQARYDEMTGLLNRPGLLHALGKACQKATPFSLITFDIDRFGLANELHGYDVGDSLLIAVAGRLRRLGGDFRYLARLGDDQFALVSAVDSPTEPLAELLSREFRSPLELGEHAFKLSLSIGVANYPTDANTAKALLNAADSAMHWAKKSRGMSCEYFRREMHDQRREMHEKEARIRQGLERNEFILYYQPKVSAGHYRLSGFEALARWVGPDGKVLGPMAFIEDIERLGLIDQLGWKLLRLACSQSAAWKQATGRAVPIAVNISPLQLREADFDLKLAELLAEYAIQAGQIGLEITESTAMADPDGTRELIGKLHRLGVPLALDDFGTGYSSLATLRDFRLSELKLDRSIVAPLPENESMAIVRAVIELGRALNMRVVAEGIESDEQATMVSSLGCDELQGFHFSRPLPPEEAVAWFHQMR